MHLLAGVDLTTKSVERTAENIGADIARTEQRQVDAALQRDLPIVVGEPIPALYIELDGTGVPVVKAETEGRQGKIAGQSAHTREAKLGCVFTQTTYGEEGYAIRDPGSTTYTGAIETAAEFGKRLYLEAWNRGWSRALTKVALGDGAEWIWNIASQHFPGAIQIVYLYHARQHLWNVARCLYPLDQAAQHRWISRHQPKLDGGRIETLVAYLHSLNADSTAATEIIAVEAAYFEKTPLGCAIPIFANSIFLSAPASSQPDVKPSSASASNRPACSGPSAAPTPSSLSAAAIPREAPNADGLHRELIEGELQVLPPPKSGHTKAAERAYKQLTHIERAAGGQAYLEAGYQVFPDKRTWIQLDVSFLRTDRVQSTADSGYFMGAPNLAIEAVSPSESAADLNRKVELLPSRKPCRLGALPKQREVRIFLPTGVSYRKGIGDTLSLPELLPGWEFPVARLFED